MKVLKLEGKETLSLHNTNVPDVKDNHQLITIAAVGIGGSEYLGFKNPGIRPLPNIMGHSISGETQAGERVTVYPLSGCGNCAFCHNNNEQLCNQWSLIGVQTDGGFSEMISVSNDQLFALPDDLSWEQSVFIEPFANAINAWEISGASANDRIAIIGSGSLGLGLTAMAQQTGCKDICVAELSNSRKDAATVLGATHTTETLDGLFDIVFDTVGSIETRNQTIHHTKKGGSCIFLGFESQELTLNISEIIRYQKTLKGSFVYSRNQFMAAIELAKSCDKNWVKNIYFDDVENTLKEFLDGNFRHIKVALRPNGIEKHSVI